MDSRKKQGSFNTLFLSHAPSEVLNLHLIKENYLEFVFKVNLLFFDSIAINASALLGNPFFFQLAARKDEKSEVMSKLYGIAPDSDHPAIRPVCMGKSRNIGQVAENMINQETKTIHGLEHEKLLGAHADSIANHYPLSDYIIHDNEKDFRKRYYENMCLITDKIMKDDDFCVQYGLRDRFPAGSLMKLAKWLQLSKERESLYCSQIFNFVEGKYKKNREKELEIIRDIKILSLAIHQHTFISTSDDVKALASPRRMASYIQCMRLISEQNTYPIQDSFSSDQILIPLPLKEICDMDIDDFIEIRNLSEFKILRRRLAIFRELKEDSPDWVGDILVKQLLKCKEELECHIVKGIPFRDFLLKQRARKKLASVIDAINIVFTPLGLVAIEFLHNSGANIRMSPIVILSSFSVAAALYAKRLRPGNNDIQPEFTGKKIEVNPVTGSASEDSDS